MSSLFLSQGSEEGEVVQGRGRPPLAHRPYESILRQVGQNGTASMVCPEIPEYRNNFKDTVFQRTIKEIDNEGFRVQQRTAPPAKMVTASQEQRGITHREAPIIVSDVLPQHQDSPEVPRSRGKKRAIEMDEFEAEADRIAQRQELEDGDFTSQQCEQEVDIPFNAVVPPEELDHVLRLELGQSSRPLPVRRALAEKPSREVALSIAPKPSTVFKRTTTKLRAKESPKKQTRNQRYSNCDIPTQLVRDAHIKLIMKNWNNPRLFWPDKLAPRGVESEPLEPKDVAANLLAAINRLSDITKNDVEEAYGAMKKAVNKRIYEARKHAVNRTVKRFEGSERLLPDDVEDAIRIIERSIRRSNEGRADSGSPAYLPHARSSPSRQLQDEMVEDIVAVAGPSNAQQEDGVFIPTMEVSSSPEVDMGFASMAGPSNEQQDSSAVVAASERSSSPELEIVGVHPKARSACRTGRDWNLSMTMPADCEWSERVEQIQQLFYMTAKDARANGKEMVVNFGLTQ